MELEKLIQRLELESSQFQTALDRSRRDLSATGRASDAATRQITTGFRGAAAGVTTSGVRINSATAGMTTGFGRASTAASTLTRLIPGRGAVLSATAAAGFVESTIRLASALDVGAHRPECFL